MLQQRRHPKEHKAEGACVVPNASSRARRAIREEEPVNELENPAEEEVDVAPPDFPSVPSTESVLMASTRIHIRTAVCLDQRLLISDFDAHIGVRKSGPISPPDHQLECPQQSLV